jgi:hypothetical protein
MKTLALAAVLVLAASTTHAAIIMSCDNKDEHTAAIVHAAGADEGTALAAPEVAGVGHPGALAQRGTASVDPGGLEPEPLLAPSRIVAAIGPLSPELNPDAGVDGVNHASGLALCGIWPLGGRDADLSRAGILEELEKDPPSLATDSTATPSTAAAIAPTSASSDPDNEETLNVVPPGSPAPFALAFLCGGLGLILVGRR